MHDRPEPSKDYYAILGVLPTAEAEEIASAFRALARTYHPDVRPEDETAASHFKRINEAYEILSDPAKRRHYDRQEARRQAHQAEPTRPPVWPKDMAAAFGPRQQSQGDRSWDEIDQLLGALWGGYGRENAGRRDVGIEDVDVWVDVTLLPEEVMQGGRYDFTLTLEESCWACHARGQMMGRACPDCSGRGILRYRRPLVIHIPPGIRAGSVLRIPGGGKSASGDLYLRVRVRPY